MSLIVHPRLRHAAADTSDLRSDFWGRLNAELDSSLGEVSSVRGRREEAEFCVTNYFLPIEGGDQSHFNGSGGKIYE